MKKQKRVPKTFQKYFQNYNDFVKFQCYLYSHTGMTIKDFKRFVESNDSDDINSLLTRIKRSGIKMIKAEEYGNVIGAIDRLMIWSDDK